MTKSLISFISARISVAGSLKYLPAIVRTTYLYHTNSQHSNHGHLTLVEYRIGIGMIHRLDYSV